MGCCKSVTRRVRSAGRSAKKATKKVAAPVVKVAAPAVKAFDTAVSQVGAESTRFKQSAEAEANRIKQDTEKTLNKAKQNTEDTLNDAYQVTKAFLRGDNPPSQPPPVIETFGKAADTSASASKTTVGSNDKEELAKKGKDKSKTRETSLGGYKRKSGIQAAEASGLGFKKKTKKKQSGLGV